jgi:ATP-dependent DNA ligase
LIAIQDWTARAFTRNGHDWTGRYGPIVKACAGLRCRSALIDGEVVVEDEHGISDFDALPYAIRRYPHRLSSFAFDLLHLDGTARRAPDASP